MSKKNKIAARRRGNQAVIYRKFGEGFVHYTPGSHQVGDPTPMTVAYFEQNYGDTHYLLDDPTWEQPDMSELVGKARKEAVKVMEAGPESPLDTLSADRALTIFKSYVDAYRVTNSEDLKMQVNSVGMFLITLDPTLEVDIKKLIDSKKPNSLV